MTIEKKNPVNPFLMIHPVYTDRLYMKRLFRRTVLSIHIVASVPY